MESKRDVKGRGNRKGMTDWEKKKKRSRSWIFKQGLRNGKMIVKRVVRARRIRERLWLRVVYWSLRFQKKYISRETICCFPTGLRLENGICIT